MPGTASLGKERVADAAIRRLEMKRDGADQVPGRQALSFCYDEV